MEMNREDHRIFIEEQGWLPIEFTFPLVNKQVVDINYTSSDISLRGQGIRGVLMEEAVTVTRKKCWKCTTFSPYALAWTRKHKKEQDIWIRGEPR